jgi:transposase
LWVIAQAERETIRALEQRIADLEEQIRLNSSNSSKPPSSDGPGGGKRASRRPKPASGKKRGAQRGHPGHHRAMVPETDLSAIVECPPPATCACGGAIQASHHPWRHQVFELPRIVPEITEYRCYTGRCRDCGQRYPGQLPAGVPTGQLGPRALGLVGILAGRFHLTQDKIRIFLDELMGIRFSLGCVSQAHGKVAQALAAPMDELNAALARAPVRHADETSHQSHCHHLWLWAVVTEWGAQFAIRASRAAWVAKELLGMQPDGVVVSDRYAAYGFVDCEHRQVCWAHLLRDFERIAGRPGRIGRLGRQLATHGALIFRWREDGRLPQDFGRLQRRIKHCLEIGASQSICGKTARTCQNLLGLWTALWHFLKNPAVPPTNNLAERVLRGVVLRRKISYLTRSGRGMRFIERMFPAVETCKLQHRSLTDFIFSAMAAWISGTPPPSLVPEQFRGA